MTSSAIVLLILFILAAALLLYYYLRHRLRSLPLRRRGAASELTLFFPASLSGASSLLPRFKFSNVTRPGAVTVTGDCPICLSEFESEHHLHLLPLCLHAFHVYCIDTWLADQSQICPVCRARGLPV